ncbi:hypothetical protein AX14_003346 [Amanita brunnescens Koide BX004]|nr:hypothetical protein AX14_003346 [Amanita brunnescens Koide BX004]
MAEQQPDAQSSNMAQAKPTSYGKSPLRVSYKVPFSLRFRYAITSIARFFRIMQQPQPNYVDSPEFLPIKNGNRVDAYSGSLSLVYINPKTVRLARDHWKVAEIKTYKDKSSAFKHEYLIARLVDGDKGEVHLRIERRIQDSSVKAYGKAILMGRSRSQPLPPSDSDSSKQDAAPSNDENTKTWKKTSADEVAIVTSNPNKHKLVEHMVFEGEHRVSLPQLIVLTCAINNYSNEYHLFQKNCYWFCNTVLELLKRLATPSSPDLPARGQQGTWLGMRADKLYKDVDFDALLAKYNAMWKAFEDGIEEIINHPDNKHLKEAREQVQEEKKRADEAERRAEQSDKRAEEEKRRAEEEKRRAEESEKRRLEEKKEMERRIAELEAKVGQTKAI